MMKLLRRLVNYKKKLSEAIAITFMLAWPSEPWAQPRLEYVRPLGKNHQIKIDGADFLALSRESVQRSQFIIDSLKIELNAAQRQMAAKDTLLATFERTNSTYSKNFSLQDSLISQTRSLYLGYRELYRDTRKLYSEPWLRFSGGLGAVREQQGDNDLLPVILLGLSIKRLAFWGFLNKEQSGFLAGVNYPLSL